MIPIHETGTATVTGRRRLFAAGQGTAMSSTGTLRFVTFSAVSTRAAVEKIGARAALKRVSVFAAEQPVVARLNA